MLLLYILHFIAELAIALRGDLYLLTHGNIVQYNTVLTYEKTFSFFFHDNATLDAVTYVTEFL